MKKWWILGIVALAIFAVASVYASPPEPGSESDPLVTKSYVESYVQREKAALEGRIAELEKKVEDLAGEVARLKGARTVITLTIGEKSAYVGGERRTLEVAPFTEGGVTLVPFRFVGEALGAEVGYDGATSTVTYRKGSTVIELKLGSTAARVSGREVKLEVAPRLAGGVTVVPVRVVSEYLGARVDYDPAKRTITITAP